MSRVLAICAHPDDETLGCGGTLLKHKAAGDDVAWLIGTDPWEPLFSAAYIERREAQIRAIAEAYGMSAVKRLHLPTTKLDQLSLGEVIDPMRAAIADLRPDIVYVVHRGDVHSDHRVIFDAAFSVLKPFVQDGAREIFCYETISSTNMAPPLLANAFIPQAYSDITPFIKRKLEIFSLYEGEVFAAPHPRSLLAIEALARYRGSSINREFAESFMVIRKVW